MNTKNRALRWRGAGILAALAVCVPAFGEAPFDYKNPPQGVFLEDWMLIELMGQKVGYVNNQLSRSGDKIETYMLTTFSMKRVNMPVSITIIQTSEAKLDGTPLSFHSQMDASKQTMETRGVVKNGKLHLSSTQFGVETKQVKDFPKDALMSWGLIRKQYEMGLAEGTKYSVGVFDPSVNDVVETDIEVQGPETIELDGKQVEAIRTVQKMKLPGMPAGFESVTWVDEQGNVLRNQLNLMNMPFTMTRATKEEALAEFSPPEFFMPTTIRVDRSIDRQAAKRIDYVLSLKDETSEMPPLPRTAMQAVEPVDPRTVKVTVRRLDHAALEDAPAAKDGEDAREYLAPNPIINCDDPAVVAMAKEARGDATTPYAIADALRRYVTREIKDKNLNVAFASASEVCRNKEGDCSEHGVLLAALGRACGIPTRVVTGIVYVPVFGGDNDIFGFHMWTQFLIGDTWVDFDAAQRESDCNPTHIAFNVSSLHEAGLGQIAFSLLNVIGNLDLKIERVE